MSNREGSSTFPLSKILVAIDGSDNSKRALDVALILAKTYHSELLILHAIPAPRILVSSLAETGFGLPPAGIEIYREEMESDANYLIENALAASKKEKVENVRTEIVHDARSITGEIVEAAMRDKTDLIVIGTRGLGGFQKILQGSVSSGVVTHAHCNVLVVR